MLLILKKPMKTKNREVPGKKKPGTFVGTGKVPGEKNQDLFRGVGDEARLGKRKTWKASWVLSCRARLHRWGIEDAFGRV